MVNLLQPLTLVEFEATLRENVTIQQLKNLRLAVPLNEIYFHPAKSTMILFLDEVLAKTIPDDYVNDSLYRFLWNAIQLLDDAIDERNFHIWCLMEISRHYGFYPFLQSDDPLYFDWVEASFTNTMPSHFCFLQGAQCQALLDFWNKEWLQVQPIQLHSSMRKTLLETMLSFLQLHLDNLREIKSLPVLHQVFHG